MVIQRRNALLVRFLNRLQLHEEHTGLDPSVFWGDIKIPVNYSIITIASLQPFICFLKMSPVEEAPCS